MELLSCTSETTAEIWNDGGIARVFGKPMLLEIMVEQDDSKTDPAINFVYKATGSWKEQESETSGDEPVTTARDNDLELSFKRSCPNRSLNKGIKRRPKIWFYGATILGFVMVCGMTSAFAKLEIILTPKYRSLSNRSHHYVIGPFQVPKGGQAGDAIFLSLLPNWSNGRQHRHDFLCKNH